MIEKNDNLVNEKNESCFLNIIFYGIISLCFCVLCGFLGAMFIIEIFNVEKDCVSFYKENGYILKVCDMYEDKLLKLDLKVDDSEE